jgi:hypothetical protein
VPSGMSCTSSPAGAAVSATPFAPAITQAVPDGGDPTASSCVSSPAKVVSGMPLSPLSNGYMIMLGALGAVTATVPIHEERSGRSGDEWLARMGVLLVGGGRRADPSASAMRRSIHLPATFAKLAPRARHMHGARPASAAPAVRAGYRRWRTVPTKWAS